MIRREIVEVNRYWTHRVSLVLVDVVACQDQFSQLLDTPAHIVQGSTLVALL